MARPTRFSLLAIAAPAVWFSSCVTREEMNRPADPLPPPAIEKLSPAVTAAGAGFTVQPSGESAIAVAGDRFQPASKVRFNGRPLNTTFGGPTSLTALVPADLYAQPGLVRVTVQNPDGQVSNEARFVVIETNAPAPVITRLSPAAIPAGRTFNVQPGGASALAIEGANFLPGAVAQFAGKALVTTFGSAALVTAVVPAELLSHPGEFEVMVKNPGGKDSYAATFRVER